MYRASKKFRHKFTPYIGSNSILDGPSKRDVIISQNSIAYESDSEIIAGFPYQSQNFGKFNKMTCKLCGSHLRSESLSSLSSDFNGNSSKANCCFSFLPRRLTSKDKHLIPKTPAKLCNDTLCNGTKSSATYNMCNNLSSTVLNQNSEVIACNTKESKNIFTRINLCRWQKKQKIISELEMTQTSNFNPRKGVYISHESETGSSISGSSLVCIKDENDSSDNDDKEVDEKKVVEEGINNLMREHFEAKTAAKMVSKSQRYTLLRKIFSPKENDRSVLYRSDTEKVEIDDLNNTDTRDSVHKSQGDDEDSEEVRDKPTSLSPFASNRERISQKNRVTVHQTLLNGVPNGNDNAGRIKTKSKERRKSLNDRSQNMLLKRNSNYGVCNSCKRRNFGSPVGNSRTPSDSESSHNTSATAQSYSTPLRSHSLRYSSRPPMHLSSNRACTSRGNNEGSTNFQQFSRRSNVSFSLSQETPGHRSGNYIRRSLSYKSSSPVAFRRTHSVRCHSNGTEQKRFTRRRTTTIGTCNFPDGANEIISTVYLIQYIKMLKWINTGLL